MFKALSLFSCLLFIGQHAYADVARFCSNAEGTIKMIRKDYSALRPAADVLSEETWFLNGRQVARGIQHRVSNSEDVALPIEYRIVDERVVSQSSNRLNSEKVVVNRIDIDGDASRSDGVIFGRQVSDIFLCKVKETNN